MEKTLRDDLLIFNRVYRLEIQSDMLVFSVSFVNYCPSNVWLTSPFLKSKYSIYRQCVAERGQGGGC
jgi:hypothetical protein